MTVDVEFACEKLKKSLAPAGIQRQIGPAEIGCSSARADLAAASVETAQHLLTELVGVPAEGFGPRRSRQNTARQLGDLTPRAPEICQGSVEHPFEEASGGGIAISHNG